jgi:hypothetical protein
MYRSTRFFQNGVDLYSNSVSLAAGSRVYYRRAHVGRRPTWAYERKSMIANNNLPKFPLGQLVATPGALEALQAAGQSPAESLDRHVRADWGEVDAHDKAANDEALVHGERLLSAYRTRKGEKLWVITEADRSSTCVLLPEEY